MKTFEMHKSAMVVSEAGIGGSVESSGTQLYVSFHVHMRE